MALLICSHFHLNISQRLCLFDMMEYVVTSCPWCMAFQCCSTVISQSTTAKTTHCYEMTKDVLMDVTPHQPINMQHGCKLDFPHTSDHIVQAL